MMYMASFLSCKLFIDLKVLTYMPKSDQLNT